MTTAKQTPTEGIRAKVSSQRKRYALLILVGFALRFGFVIWEPTYVGSANTMTPFGAEVCRLATHIAAGEGFRSPFHGGDTGPSAWVAPVYPYLVAAVFRLFGNYTATSALILLGLQCMMGAVTGAVIYELGVRSLGERIGYWAAWIWTLSPIFFRWPASWIWDFAASALLLTLTFVMTLDAGETVRGEKWLALGVIWGLIALTNPALLALLPFSFLQAAWTNRKACRSWIPASIYALATFVVIISPWLVRNYVVFGRPVFLRDNYWFEFSLGNYHNSNGLGYSGKHPDNNPAIHDQVAKMGELEFIAYHKKEALGFVRQYPHEFVELSLHRAWWFWDGTFLTYQGNEWWSPWEFWPLSAIGWLGLLFVFTRRPPGWLLYAAALVVYPVPYYFAYPQAKYRHAIEPVLLLLGVYLVHIAWDEIAGSGGAQTGN